MEPSDSRLAAVGGRSGYWFNFSHADQEFKFWIDEPPDTIQDVIVRTCDFYEASELQLVKGIIPPLAHILDVGANIGNHAVFFDRVCRAEKIILIEPNDDVIRDLIANTEANRCCSLDLTTLGFAAGNKNAEAVLTLSQQDEAIRNRGGMRLSVDRAGGHRTIQVRPLDELNIERVDFMKIDVEGCALEVLQGAQSIVDRCRPSILVEVEIYNLSLFLDWMHNNSYELLATLQNYIGILNLIILPRNSSTER